MDTKENANTTPIPRQATKKLFLVYICQSVSVCLSITILLCFIFLPFYQAEYEDGILGLNENGYIVYQKTTEKFSLFDDINRTLDGVISAITNKNYSIATVYNSTLSAAVAIIELIYAAVFLVLLFWELSKAITMLVNADLSVQKLLNGKLTFKKKNILLRQPSFIMIVLMIADILFAKFKIAFSMYNGNVHISRYIKEHGRLMKDFSSFSAVFILIIVLFVCWGIASLLKDRFARNAIDFSQEYKNENL